MTVLPPTLTDSETDRHNRKSSVAATMLTATVVIVLTAFASILTGCKKVPPPEPYGACPTAEQLEWQRMEMNMFCHFGPNTFTDAEWGDGTESEAVFNPTALDCRQWAEVARHAGMGGIIVTAKHHDGFCLWPSLQSSHTVRESPWRNGKGDVLRELREACDAVGIKMGIYVSPWDRNAPTYGTAAYNETFRSTLEEVLSNYGDIYEQWFDGANGEGPNGKKQVYDWPLFNSTVAQLQPHAVIFSDVGPGCRWVGNEEGKAGETCWSTLNIEGFTPGAGSPGTEVLNHGERGGSHWVPAETDVSIRPGWFYHENEQPKSLQQLLEIYYNSVGRNSLLLLNIPPDRRGLIPAADSSRVVELRHALDDIFSNNLASKARVGATHVRGGYKQKSWIANPRQRTNAKEVKCQHYSPLNVIDDDYDSYWTVDDSVLSPTLTLFFDDNVTFNRIMLQEYIPLGQRVQKYHVEVREVVFPEGTDDTFYTFWETVAEGTTIGYKRILLIPTVTTHVVRITFDSALACPVINNIGLYMDKIYDN